MLNFPNTPTPGTTYNSGGVTWMWDGAKWTMTVSGGNNAVNSAAIGNVGRNLLHNPLFNIWQRGAGPFAGNLYNADRWIAANSGSFDTVSFARATLSDGDRTAIGDEAAIFCFSNTFTGSANAAAQDYVEQRVESVRRLAGKTVTVSFWAMANTGGTKLGLNMYQLFGSGGSPSTYVQVLTTGLSVTLTGSWVRYSATINVPSAAGKTLGTNGDDYTIMRFFYSSGATGNQAAGNIGVQSGTIQLWGVQLEIGSVATPLEKPDPQQDLAKCQRFYQTGTLQFYIYSAAGGTVGGTATLSTIMRTTPTITPSFTTSNVTAPAMSSLGGNTAVNIYGSATATGTAQLQANFTASADL